MADRDKQSSTRQPAPNPGSEAASPQSIAQQVLSDLGAKLDRLEKELAEREHRVVRAEEDMRRSAAQLREQMNQLAASQDRQRGIASELEVRLEQISQLEAHLVQRDKNLQAAAKQIEELKREVASHTAERRKLAETNQRLEAEVSSLRDPIRHQDRNQQPVEHAMSAAKKTGEADVEADRVHHASQAARRKGGSSILPVIAASLLIGGLVVWGTYDLLQPQATGYRVIGTITAPPGDEKTLTACARAAGNQDVDQLEIDVDVAAGLLTLTHMSRDRSEGIGLVDGIGRDILNQMPAVTDPPGATASPDSATVAKVEELKQTLSAIDRQLAEERVPEGVDTGNESVELITSWSSTESDRRKLAERLAALGNPPDTSAANPGTIVLGPARLAQAEQQDGRLQADLTALTQREQDLEAALDEILSEGAGPLARLADEIETGSQRVEQVFGGDYGDAIQQSLLTLRDAIETWESAREVLAAAWKRTDAPPEESTPADSVARQRDLEQAARAFVEQTSGGLVRFQAALAAIGQDNDEPTKGLVLQRGLNQNLAPLVSTRAAVEAAARRLILADNLDLTGLVQRVTGVRRQVDQRREQIASTLREQLADEWISHANAKWHEERTTVESRMADLDRRMEEHVAKARALMRRQADAAALLAELVRLYRMRAEASRELSSLLPGTPAGSSASGARSIHYVPARAEPLRRSPSDRGLRAGLAGIIAFAGCLLVWVGGRGWLSRQRADATIEEYTRQLEEAVTPRHRRA